MLSFEERVSKALGLAFQYSQIDGGHHKAWVIDQMVKILCQDGYAKFVDNYEHDKETGEKYEWDTGIAP